MKNKILIVEDDPAISTLISSTLTVSGYEGNIFQKIIDKLYDWGVK